MKFKQMKTIITTITLVMTLSLMGSNGQNPLNQTKKSIMDIEQQQDSLLRHVVLFKFKPGTSKENIAKVEAAFSALPSKIPQIVGYEWGLNNSPEGLDKG